MTRFVIPFGREGASDRAARAFAHAFAAAGGGELAIENVPGEGGLAGVRHANGLLREGAPLLLLSTPTTHTLLRARLGPAAAPREEFRPFLALGSAPNVLLVPPRLGVRSVSQLVELARRQPLTYASAGAGQTIDVCTVQFMRAAGIAMAHRPYAQGSVLAYAGLRSGEADVYFDNVLGCSDRIASGEVLPLAVSSAARSRLLPEVPALAECGFPDYALDVWIGVFAASAPRGAWETAARLEKDARFRGALEGLGLAGGPLGATEFARAVDESGAAWGRAR